MAAITDHWSCCELAQMIPISRCWPWSPACLSTRSSPPSSATPVPGSVDSGLAQPRWSSWLSSSYCVTWTRLIKRTLKLTWLFPGRRSWLQWLPPHHGCLCKSSSTIRHPHLYISRSQLGYTTIIIITSSNLVTTRQLLCLQSLDISWPLESWWRSRGRRRRRTSSPSPSMCRTRLPHKSHTWNSLWSMKHEEKKTENVPNIWLFTLLLFYWYPQLIFDEINLVATLYI